MRVAAIVTAGALILALAGVCAWVFQRRSVDRGGGAREVSSAEAFARSYLDAVAGKAIREQRSCKSCHEIRDAFAPEAWAFLSARRKLSEREWAAALHLEARCGSCHVTPDPRTLPWRSWNEAVDRMDRIMEQKGIARLSEEERRDLVHYYYTFSPEQMPRLAEDPDPKASPVQFKSVALGNRIDGSAGERPFIGHVAMSDLDQDGRRDVLVCDSDNSSLSWIRAKDGVWEEHILATVPSPGRAEVFTNHATGRVEIVVACQERMVPTDDLIGSVVLVRNEGKMQFTPVTILSNISRVAAVEPGDFNNDGEIDFVVAAFGFVNMGEVGWLKQQSGSFTYQTVVKRTGAIRVSPIDLNGDGFLDFVALFGQEHEQISAFVNDGNASFREVVLFKAATPSFGSSGIELVDLDQDGDMDILYTNGDNMDLATRIPRPYHGVQWLENRGDLQFHHHDIFRFYGAYAAVPADVDQDGQIDIVVTSLFNDWQDPRRASLIWLRNDGRQQFTPHGIAREPIQLISAAVGDLNQDGWPDIVASGMHIFPPFDRMGRVTLWTRVSEARR